MKLPILTALLFSLSCLANLCDVQFLRSYYAVNPVQVEAKTKKSLEELFQMTRKAKTPREKLDLLGEQYDMVSRFYDDKVALAKQRVQNMDVPEEEAAKLLKQSILETIDDIKLYPNRIVNQAKKVFEEAGISVNVRFRKVDENIKFKYLELGDTEGGGSRAIKIIQRYKNRFGTEIVTFDIFQNIMNGSAGFSQAQIRRIDLGIRGMRNLVLDDIITMVGKHEFHHAAFAAKRANNASSIYHTQYIANGEKNLSSISGGYDRFMSAEELYNWANNSYWASTRIKNVSKYQTQDYLYDIGQIHGYLGGTKNLAAQTQEIAENTIESIKKMRKELDAGEMDFILLTEEGSMARSADEAFEFVLFDSERKILIKEFIGPEYSDEVNKIFENRIKIEAENADAIARADGDQKAMSSLMKDLVKKENAKSKEAFLKVLETFEGKQKTLSKVAKALAEETETVFYKTDDFVKRLKKALEQDKASIKDPRWEAEFKELAMEYRKLGNLVKEDYKGFAGR